MEETKTYHVNVEHLDSKAIVVLPQDSDGLFIYQSIAGVLVNGAPSGAGTTLELGNEEWSIGAVHLVCILPLFPRFSSLQLSFDMGMYLRLQAT
jgi:hypothetical protein